jgi:hypothetical protein
VEVIFSTIPKKQGQFSTIDFPVCGLRNFALIQQISPLFFVKGVSTRQRLPPPSAGRAAIS